MRIAELMSTNVATTSPSANLHDAVEQMCRRGVRHLPVVDDTGRLIGIVTDRDLRHHLFGPKIMPDVGRVPVESLLKAASVRDVMSTPVISVAPHESLEAAGRLMLEAKLGCLPVVSEGHVVGIVTETDLLRRIVRDDACCNDVGVIVVSYP